MKLLIALALAAAPSALALAPYVPSEKNGCGEPCEGDVVTLDETSGVFDAIEDNKCYVVDGTFTGIIVPDGVSCAKITVPEGAKLQGIDAHLPRPSFDSTPNETLRRGARRSKATTRRYKRAPPSSSSANLPAGPHVRRAPAAASRLLRRGGVAVQAASRRGCRFVRSRRAHLANDQRADARRRGYISSPVPCCFPHVILPTRVPPSPVLAHRDTTNA